MKKKWRIFGITLISFSLLGLGGCDKSADLQQPVLSPALTPQANPLEGRARAVLKKKIGEGDASLEGDAPPSTKKPLKIALLLPLSGTHSKLGQELLKAAELSLFDGEEGSTVTLIIRDTKGTPAGAKEALYCALEERVQGVLGPLLAPEVIHIKPIARKYHLPVITFSTDLSVVEDGVFTMGFLPLPQVRRILQEANRQGMGEILCLLPRHAYGDLIEQEINLLRQKENIPVRTLLRYHPEAMTVEKSALKELEPALETLREGSFSALFIPEGGISLEKIAFVLSKQGLSPQSVYYLGTGQWDSPKTLQDPLLEGALFAAPNPEGRRSFEKRFYQVYGTLPSRLATLSYDGVALLKALDRMPGGFSLENIKLSRGFQGIDGIFRFNASGLIERDLSILVIRNGKLEEITPSSPRFFHKEN